MRILMLSWEYPPNVVGGLGKHVAELVPALADRDLEVHIVTPARGGKQGLEAGHRTVVHRIAVPSGVFSSFYTEAAQANLSLQQAGEEIIEADGPFDLVHTHDWLTSVGCHRAQAQIQAPLGRHHPCNRTRPRSRDTSGRAGPENQRCGMVVDLRILARHLLCELYGRRGARVFWHAQRQDRCHPQWRGCQAISDA